MPSCPTPLNLIPYFVCCPHTIKSKSGESCKSTPCHHVQSGSEKTSLGDFTFACPPNVEYAIWIKSKNRQSREKNDPRYERRNL